MSITGTLNIINPSKIYLKAVMFCLLKLFYRSHMKEK